MRTFVYRARFEPGEKRGVIVVSFPDVPEAITEGRGEADATAQAQEALGLALLTYPVRNVPLPKPKAKGGDFVPIAVEAAVAAKLAFLDAFREAGIGKLRVWPKNWQGREGSPPSARSKTPYQAEYPDGGAARSWAASRHRCGGRGIVEELVGCRTCAMA